MPRFHINSSRKKIINIRVHSSKPIGNLIWYVSVYRLSFVFTLALPSAAPCPECRQCLPWHLPAKTGKETRCISFPSTRWRRGRARPGTFSQSSSQTGTWAPRRCWPPGRTPHKAKTKQAGRKFSFSCSRKISSIWCNVYLTTLLSSRKNVLINEISLSFYGIGPFHFLYVENTYLRRHLR